MTVPPRRRVGAAVLCLTTTAMTVACTRPASQAELEAAQAFLDVQEEMRALREESALLQQQIDSLRGVVARHDTLLVRVAAVAGVTVPGR
ncbi:MAG TPA: hypothetical protein VNA89_04545 [Gemmatimonadaceae bacterium]|nr:hypothetical protein [Gemmatimonadaceae bacterium]